MTNPPASFQPGAFVNRSSSASPIGVDGIECTLGVTAERWRTGQFVLKSTTTPAIEVDGTHSCFVELHITVPSSAEPVRSALDIVELLDAVNRYDTMLGGAGYRNVAEKVSSALSRLNFRVKPLQFHPCFVDGELPIDGSLLFGDAR